MGQAEWSFGDRESGGYHQNSGFHMPVSGHIIRMSLSSVAQGDTVMSSISVNFIIRWVRNADYGITKESGKISAQFF